MSLMKIKQERLFVVLLCWECPDALRQSPLGEYEDSICAQLYKGYMASALCMYAVLLSVICARVLLKKNKKTKQADHRESLQKNVAH